MNIKEVETRLSVSRANIRFYEKQGLLSPERRENNYRDYSEADILTLKKIVLFRKMGLSIEEILQVQNGERSLSEVIPDAQKRLEAELEQLNGSLNLIKKVSKDMTSHEEIDYDACWESMQAKEAAGEKFIDIWKDYLVFELNLFDNMWKYVFFHDFKRSREKHGVLKAWVLILLLCILRGIGRMLNHQSFWSGFLYPFLLALLGSIIVLPLYVLSKKAPRVAAIISTVLSFLILLFFAGLILLILYGIVVSIIS